jgi:5-methylcytosine-specific restriction endonuclease McrA
VARPGLTNHRKFRRLQRTLGSALIARGALELLWESCYESGDDYVGTAEDIEHLVGWTGTPGQLTTALLEAGQPDGVGFLETVEPGDDGIRRYRVHELWANAPREIWARYSPAGRARHAVNCQRRRAREVNAAGTFTAAEWLDLLALFGGQCAYCHEPMVAPTQDHVIPLSRGGRNDRTNILPACARCNSQKGTKTAAEFGHPGLQRWVSRVTR